MSQPEQALGRSRSAMLRFASRARVDAVASRSRVAKSILAGTAAPLK